MFNLSAFLREQIFERSTKSKLVRLFRYFVYSLLLATVVFIVYLNFEDLHASFHPTLFLKLIGYAAGGCFLTCIALFSLAYLMPITLAIIAVACGAALTAEGSVINLVCTYSTSGLLLIWILQFKRALMTMAITP